MQASVFVLGVFAGAGGYLCRLFIQMLDKPSLTKWGTSLSSVGAAVGVFVGAWLLQIGAISCK